MDQVQSFRKQGQLYKTKGAAGSEQSKGSWSEELFGKANIAAGTTDGAIIAAVASKKIRVLSYSVSALTAAATTATFRSKPGGTGLDVSHVISLAANGNSSEESEFGLFETITGEGLSLTTGAGAGVGVRVTYVLVD
jgi:hypothetical protein